MLNNGVALFGGSFNPPTLAHMSIIEGAAKSFSRVVVMPAAISPFKPAAKRIPGEDRLSMLKKMCCDLSNVDVSSYELDEKGISYTFKTVQHLKGVYSSEIYLVIGSDNIDSLNRWKNFDELKKDVIFYIVPRPFFAFGEHEEKILGALGCRYVAADFSGKPGSSTIVPLAKAFHKLHEVVPDVVAEYIESGNLFTSLEYVEKIYDRFRVKPERREHIYRTAVTAAALAAKYSADVEKTITAAVLHDAGKYVSVRQLEDEGFVFDSEAHDCPPAVEHCYTGEVIARDVAHIDDREILRAIRLHTTGDADMTTHEKIIFCADYIEYGRTTPGVETIRREAFINLDKAMIMIIDSTMSYLKSKNAVIDRRMLVCRQWLKNIIAKENKIDNND